MFSLDKFYNILHSNLINPISGSSSSLSLYFNDFGTYNTYSVIDDEFDSEAARLLAASDSRRMSLYRQTYFHCYFFDQEPFYKYTKTVFEKSMIAGSFAAPDRINILANSEKSELLADYVKSGNLYNWYYFFHGFAALDWYRDFQFVPEHYFDRFDKVFICYNHLTSKYRSYRLHLVSNLIDQDLVKHGHVSLFLSDKHGTWQETIRDPDTPLDNRARVHIFKTLRNITQPLTIDTNTPTGAMSAEVRLDQLTSAFFHVVTETVYFLPKLHLTEKIFKPIVAKRPFILVAAPGNLAYLKSYGFKTFDRWIDESYDQETDNYLRIEMITAEIKKLCELSPEALQQMYQEMQAVLEYNFKYFYGEFKHVLVNELVDNFGGILSQINNGRMPNNHSKYHQRFELPIGYLEEVKQRLLK